MIYLLTIIMSKKKEEAQCKTTQNCSLQIQNPDFLFQTPDLCVFQTSYVQSFKKICVKIWITPC